MSVIIQTPVESEFLTEEEIVHLTGLTNTASQMRWLQDNSRQWNFEINSKNQIQISRWYFRLKMSGITLDSVTIDEPEEDDLPKFNLVS